MAKQEQLLREHYAQVSQRLRGKTVQPVTPSPVNSLVPVPIIQTVIERVPASDYRPPPPRTKAYRPTPIRTKKDIELARYWTIDQLTKLYELYRMGEPWEIITETTNHTRSTCQKVVRAMKLQRYLKVKKDVKPG
jgi:hypothetical protein